MRKFFKKLKDRKGFTLVELMMVVAVIGILAAVLIPKMTGARDNARLAGVEANANQVQAHVESLISRYRGTSESGYDASAFQGALVASINRSADGGTNADEDDIANPFVAGKFGADDGTDGDDKFAVIVAIGSEPELTSYDKKGLIYVNIESNTTTGAIKSVTITPYDGDENAMTDKEVKIEP